MRFGEWGFVASAFILHLALPVGAAIAPEPSWLHAPRVSAKAPTEIDVDVSQLPTEHPPEAHSDDTAAGEQRTAMNDRRPEGPRGHATPPKNDDAIEPPEQVVNGANDSPDSFPSPEPGAKPDPFHTPPSMYEVPGANGPGQFGMLPPGVLPPDHSGPTAAPTKTSKRTYDHDAARRAVDKGMRSKDAQLGLDFPAASAIAAVLRESVRASDAPYECSGSFSVTVSAAGKVTAVGLGGFSGGDSGTWQSIRKSALAQLSSRVFEMKSSFAKGAMVGVSIKSEQKMPGGGVGRQGATFSFDVADVGAKPIRVVSMSFSAKPIE